MEIDVGGANGNVSVEKSDQIEKHTMRIFVGGLGEGVTDDDLRRMFVALGSVDEIEIIRTKGRSMAYLNFTPSSAKSLAKLFSSFNGCVWKGGRLRIEKAKEHYLVKMNREKEQEREEELARNDVKLKCSAAAAAAAAADVVSLRKPIKGPDAEKEQIRIFFPKLRKVKPLPFGGCGKHKYSFRNIQVPPLPTHFCDCEIHSVPYDAPIGSTVINHDAPQSGVDEKEFDLMKSVLNKFISNDEYSSVKAVGDGPGGNVDPPSVLNDILPSEENATDSEPDEDGIVMNISGGLNEMVFSWKSVNNTVSENQEPRGNHPLALEIDAKTGSNKKQKLENEKNNVTSNAIQKKKKDDFNVVSVLSRGNNPLRNHKSKWKELVGQGSDSSFKLSNVLLAGSAHDLVQQEDLEEDLSESEESDDEMEESTDESVQQEDTDKESNGLEESDKEESPDESAEMDNEEESNKSEELEAEMDTEEESNKSEAEAETSAEDESNKSEELDAEAETSAEDELNKSEEPDADSEQVSNQFEGRDGLEEASTEDSGSESTQDSVENDEDEVESTNSDEQDNLMETELSNGSSLIHQNDFEQPPLKSGENEQQEGVKPSETEDGSVKFKKGATWSQKMPWTQLVSDMDNSSFSISQIIPGYPTENQVTANPNLMSKNISTCQSSKAVLTKTDAVSVVSLTNTTTDLHEQENLNSSGNPSRSCNTSGAIKSDEKKPTTIQAASDVKTEVREIRPFVRSADSVKEWKKLKKAFSRSQTKKRKIVEQ